MLLIILFVLLILPNTLYGLRSDRKILGGDSIISFERFGMHGSLEDDRAGLADFKVWHNSASNGSVYLAAFVGDKKADLMDNFLESGGQYDCAHRLNQASIVTALTPILNNSDEDEDGSGIGSGLGRRKNFKYKNRIKLMVDESIPKFVYFAFMNCDVNCSTAAQGVDFCGGPLDIFVSAHWTNGPESSINSEFSAHESGLYETAMVCISLQVIVLISLFWVMKLLDIQNSILPTVWFFLCSVVLFTCKFICEVLYWFMYSFDGRPSKVLWVFLRFLETCGLCALFIVVVGLAGGWTVVRRKILPIGRLRIVFLVVVYFTLRMAALTWAVYTVETRMSYELFYYSPPGLWLCALDVFVFIRFTTLALRIAAKHPELKLFWRHIRILGIFLFAHIPFLMLSVINSDEINQAKIIDIVHNFLLILIQVALVIWFHPSANRHFPYHTFLDKFRNGSHLGGLIPNESLNPGMKQKPGSSNGDIEMSTEYTGISSNLIDSVGRARIPPVDKRQLNSLRKLHKEVYSRVSTLELSTNKLGSLLNNISELDLEEIEGWSRMKIGSGYAPPSAQYKGVDLPPTANISVHGLGSRIILPKNVIRPDGDSNTPLRPSPIGTFSGKRQEGSSPLPNTSDIDGSDPDEEAALNSWGEIERRKHHDISEGNSFRTKKKGDLTENPYASRSYSPLVDDREAAVDKMGTSPIRRKPGT